jgi:hypothetical protein
MKQVFVFIACITMLAQPVMGEELKRISLDDATGLGMTIQSDSGVKAEGKGSVKITTLWPTVVCLGEVSGIDIENAKLVYCAKVKSDLDGAAFLEMWVHVAGGQYFSKGTNDVVSQKTDWKTIQTPFMFEKGQKPDKVTLNLVINGKGTVWIDDIILSREPLK